MRQKPQIYEFKYRKARHECDSHQALLKQHFCFHFDTLYWCFMKAHFSNVSDYWYNFFISFSFFFFAFLGIMKMEYLVQNLTCKILIVWYFTDDFTVLSYELVYIAILFIASFLISFRSCFLKRFKCCSTNCVWEINPIWPLLLTVKIFRIN